MEPSYGYVQSSPQNENKFSRKMIFLIAGGIVAVLIAIVLLLSNGQSGISNQSQYLVLRYKNLQTILTDEKTTRNLKNQDLSNIVTSFELAIITDQNDLNSALSGTLPVKMSESIVASEADVTTLKTIEEAYLENKLDSVYAEVLVKKINSLRALIAEVYGLTSSAKLKTTLAELDDHLLETKKKIEALNL